MPWECQCRFIMEGYHGYSKNHEATVVCIILMLHYAMCTNRWESSKVGIIRVFLRSNITSLCSRVVVSVGGEKSWGYSVVWSSELVRIRSVQCVGWV